VRTNVSVELALKQIYGFTDPTTLIVEPVLTFATQHYGLCECVSNKTFPDLPPRIHSIVVAIVSKVRPVLSIFGESIKTILTHLDLTYRLVLPQTYSLKRELFLKLKLLLSILIFNRRLIQQLVSIISFIHMKLGFLI
jgi:hypothetical protein